MTEKRHWLLPYTVGVIAALAGFAVGWHAAPQPRPTGLAPVLSPSVRADVAPQKRTLLPPSTVSKGGVR